jgi:PST family polysaccharide transporter
MNSGRGLAGSVAGGFSWNVVGSALRALLSFVLNVFLARLLGPTPFGLIALASVVTGLAGMLLDWGLSSALIQKPELEDHDVRYVFAFQMAAGLGMTLLVAALAPVLARLFAEPALTGVLRALSPVLLVQAFGQVSTALLIRHMNFRRLQEAQLISYLVGYVGLGLPLALRGFGVRSLVAAQLGQTLVNTLILFLSAPHSLAMTLRDPGELPRFGRRVLGANIASWLVPNLQSAIVGWRFGATDLGYYGRSYSLSLTPVGILVTSAQGVLFPAISQVGRGSRASRLFSLFLSALCVLLIPGYVLVAVGAREIILLLYGSAWLPAAPLLTPLALAMLAFSLSELGGPVLTGLGLPQVQLHVEWAVAGMALVILFMASRLSLVAAAWAVLLIYVLRLALMSARIVTALGLSWRSVWRPVLSGWCLAAIASAGWALATAWVPSTLALGWRVLIQAVCALGCWAAALLAGRRLFLPELREALRYLMGTRKVD